MGKQRNLNSIEQLMDGYNPHRETLEQTRQLVNKWEPTGLLEGLTNENKVHGMAVLLENQARELIDEASRTGTNTNSEEWSGVALPLVRKIFGELAAQDFVSVQPMNLPSGLIFYLDFAYSDTVGGHTADTQIFGITSGSTTSNVDPTAGLYGAGRFGYTVSSSKGPALTAAANAAANKFVTGSVSWADVDFEPTLSSSVMTGAFENDALMKMTVLVDDLTNPDLEGVRAFSISGSGFDEYFPAYTKLNAAETELTFITRKDQVAKPVAASVFVTYQRQPGATTRGDFEDVPLEPTPTDLPIPEIDIKMRSVAIVAKTRKLKAVWTP